MLDYNDPRLQLRGGERFVEDLRPGDSFDTCGTRYRLIRLGPGSAYVEPTAKTKRRVVRRDADMLDADIEFETSGGRTHIALLTVCIPVDILDDDYEIKNDKEENRDMSAAKNPNNDLPIKKAADRHFDPKKQERPVREKTIRAELLAAMEAGETNIDKLMKKFNMVRSLLVAHVHEMWKCHGYGYSVVGDTIKIVKPIGGALKSKPSTATTTPAKKTGGKKGKTVDLLDDPLADDDDPLA